MGASLSIVETTRVIRRWRWVLVLIPLLSVLATTISVVYLIPPTYEAATTLLVGRNITANQQEAMRYEDFLMSKQLVETYGEIVKSWTVAAEVIRELNLPFPIELLKKKINVTLVGATQVIRLSVYDRDPALAQQIANTAATIFVQRVPELMKLNNVSVLDPARFPTTPTRPQKALMIIVAGVAGVMMALSYVLAIEYIDGRIRNKSEAERILDIPVLGTIPKGKTAIGSAKVESFLPLIDDPRSPASEAFRSLRTNFQFYCNRKEVRVISITSAQPMEGKSTVATNLSICIAQTGKRVILVDADLRRPSIHKLLGLQNQSGLSDLLTGSSDSPEDLLIQTPIHGLMMLPCGPAPSSPAELLVGSRFTDTLGYLRNICDYVLIDTPPVIAVTDAAIISSISDSVLLVTSETRKRTAMQAKTALYRVNAQIMGVVMNQATTEPDSYYDHYTM